MFSLTIACLVPSICDTPPTIHILSLLSPHRHFFLMSNLTYSDKMRVLHKRFQEGKRAPLIAREMRCSKSTIYRVLQRFSTSGHVERASTSGRPSVMIRRTADTIVDSHSPSP